MDNAGNNSGEQGKQPASSLLNSFSSLFSRDRSASSVMESPVLTSFRELADGETPPRPEGGQAADGENKSKEKGGLLQDDGAASCDPGQRAGSLRAGEDSGEQVEDGASVDQDLVQVTKVETYSDSEHEDEEASHNGANLSEKLAKTSEPIQREEDNKTGNHGEGDELQHSTEAEYKVPVFRTHNFKERSRIEAMLYSNKFVSRASSRRGLLSSLTKQGDGSTPKESSTTMSVGEETLSAEENSSKNVGTEESDEYAAIDCSQPVPSIISGQPSLETAGHNGATASPSKQTEDLDSTEKVETHEQRTEVEDGTGKPYSSQVSSSVPTSPPKTPDASVQLSSSPVKQLDIAAITNSGSLGDIQPSTVPSQHPSAPKTPETNTPAPASPVATSSASSTSSPSRGTAVSSPPSFQMPALFSGFRVLKKGAVGDDRETVSEIKQRETDTDLALLSLKKTVNKAKLFPDQRAASPAKKHTEPKPVADTKSTVMGQLSHLLKLESPNVTRRSDSGQDASPKHSKKDSENGKEVAGEKTPAGPETPTSTPERKKTSDLAYETFRGIFGPKNVTKDKTEYVDLDAVRQKIKNDKENLRSIFERASKSPGNEVKTTTEDNVCNGKPKLFLISYF